jgi:hypothetical protein
VVYDNVVYQGRKYCRMMPDPLDAMFALGNDHALPLLADELETWKYASQLAALRYLVDSHDDAFWEGSLYNSWLQAIRLLSTSQTEAPGWPLFMRTGAWHQQKLNTQLASWTQLRHDNLLYAKQSYTRGGYACSYPYSYVEPYPAFYRQIAKFAARAAIHPVYAELGYADHYFQRLQEIMETLAGIAQKELDVQVISEEERDFLKQMLFHTWGYGATVNGWYTELFYDGDSMDEYVIADVHTQPTDCEANILGRVLHAGVGKLNLGVFLAPSQTNLTHTVAYVGPVMSYYETITEDFDRLTDSRWAETVQADAVPPRPDWANVYLADREGKAYGPGRALVDLQPEPGD